MGEMSDRIPLEVQREVIKRVVPVKSLLRLRSVCKQWKSLIDSSEFITHYSINNTHHRHHLFIRYTLDFDVKYASLVDDDHHTLSQHKLHPTLPPTVNTPPPTVNNQSMLDSTHGLVCLFGSAPEQPKIVVWNPSIRKSVGIVPPDGTYNAGFGVCPNTSNLKIVAITHNSKAEVLTLSTRVWKTVPMNMSGQLSSNPVVIDGVIHWVNEESSVRIIKFDLASEEFGEVAPPDSLVWFTSVAIYRFKDCLAMSHFREDDAGKQVCDVWVLLKNRVSESSFTKLYTIKEWSFSYHVIGFRKNGQPVVQADDWFWDSVETDIKVYDPSSEHMDGLGIDRSLFFEMVNYTESLLLLNQADSIIQCQPITMMIATLHSIFLF